MPALRPSLGAQKDSLTRDFQPKSYYLGLYCCQLVPLHLVSNQSAGLGLVTFTLVLCFELSALSVVACFHGRS